MHRLENSPFKAYDLRGRVPEALNEDRAYAIGRSYVETIQPQGPVVVGRDMRLSSPPLADALIRGLQSAGCDTIDIGLVGTEMVYHAASRSGMGGGIMVTASHNPADYNGMKLVREQAIPISGDTGLKAIESAIIRSSEKRDRSSDDAEQGRGTQENVAEDYVQRLLSHIDRAALKPMKLVVNAGNGCAGPAFDALVHSLPFDVVRLHHEPDGQFPNGVPNPLLPENRSETAQAVRENAADFGIAWDGDYDRCFFFDEDGRFIEGYYLVGLFASTLLAEHPGEKIVLDPRLIWNTLDLVEQAGGKALINKSGHAFIKERMRLENAIYGGEMSAHHYFRDFSYCDSGMLPWMLLAQTLSQHDQTLGEMLNARIQAFPCSGEINFSVSDVEQTITRVLKHVKPGQPLLDRTDGISVEFEQWRFNLRASNTEPVIRLNVETRADTALLADKVGELSDLIQKDNS